MSDYRRRPTRLPQQDHSTLGNPPHEGAFVDLQDVIDRREGRYEDTRNLTAPQVAGDEDEYPSPAVSQCRNLQRPIAETLVFGQNHPSFTAGFL